MQFGVKQGEAPAYDPDAGASGSYIKYFKDNETRLRFLEETVEWTEVWMHFSQSKSRDYPCTGVRSTCPGCNHENQREAKASKRYIVNALAPKTGYVDLWKIPASIFDDFDRQYQLSGTVQDRDFTVIKFLKEGRTNYSTDKEDKDGLDLTEYRALMKDHQEALAEAFREVWGALPNEEGYTGGDLYEAPAPKPRLNVVPEPKAEPQKSWSDGGYPDPPSEPAAPEVPEQQEITEAQLRAMTADEVLAVYRVAGVPVPAFSDKDELVDKLIAALS